MLWPLALIVLGQAVPQDPRQPFTADWKDPGYNQLVWVQSPNFNERPLGAVVDTVVIHSTVIPTLKATVGAFVRVSSQVSAHFSIGKDGSIVMSVDPFLRAWHAGVSRDAEGRANLNHFSIGIELINLNDGKDPYPPAQMQALRNVIGALKRRFPIRQLVSHEFIAIPRGRKSDPRNFPWHELEECGLPMYHGSPIRD
jgi:N-acetyl-anhydromuramyl-L-alanine amidase AmpD